MILFPNAKINLGLRVLRRRPDGYHDLETVMVPVGWTDVLEMVPSEKGGSFTLTGSSLGGCPPEKNLVIKALRALETHIGEALPPLDIYLRKNIPDGAGLGGGSADASFAIRGANEIFGLGMTDAEMASVAAKVGADCPFFIYNRPMLARGIGEILTPIDIPGAEAFHIAIAKPETEAVSTKDAYAGISPAELPEGTSLAEALCAPASDWRESGIVVNDFEPSVFAIRPAIEDTLRRMQDCGAAYAAMSGSGAAVFGLFTSAKMAEEAAARFDGCRTWHGPLGVS